MRKVFLYTLIFAGLISFQACKKNNLQDCFKSAGKIVREERPISGFHYIEIRDNINLILKQDSLQNHLVVEAGENLVPGIRTDFSNGHLLIWNDNSCNWARSFDNPLNVYLTFSKLDTIIYRAAGDLRFDTPWSADSIQFEVWEGAGRIDLDLNTVKSKIYVRYGTTDLFATGNSLICFVSSGGFGRLDLRQLQAQNIYMQTSSPNDSYVWASHLLDLTINNIGDVYYKGNPQVLQYQQNSSGKLIKLDP